jgi:hypothetical protein
MQRGSELKFRRRRRRFVRSTTKNHSAAAADCGFVGQAGWINGYKNECIPALRHDWVVLEALSHPSLCRASL